VPWIERLKKFRSNLGLCDRLLLLLITASFILRLSLINQDISVILNKFLPDDAYIYYTVAKNIINGRGIVFNYGIPANGFHPFYVLILVPIFKLLYPYGVNLPIYASLFIMTIFSLGTSVFVYLIVSKLLNKKAGLLAAFIWLFNPCILFVSFMGMETPIQIFFISLLTYFILTKEDRTQFSIHESVIIGLLVGIIFLSRMDGIFIGIGVISALAIRKLAKNKGLEIANLKRLFNYKEPDLVIIILTASLTILPWVAWNLIRVGRITPISGEVLRMMRLSGTPYSHLVIGSIYVTGTFVVNFFMYPLSLVSLYGPLVKPIIGFSIVFLALGVPFIILMRKKDDILSKLIFSLDFLVISSIFYYAFYWFYQLGLRGWYSLYTSFLVTITFSIMIVQIIQRIKFKKFKQIAYILLMCLLLSAFVSGGIMTYKEGNYPQEKLKWEIANYLDENIPFNETIGSFNTGIYQYYTKNHDVINLDGVMNPEAYQAMKDGNIEMYILEKNITYIVDDPSDVEKLNRSILDLELIKTFEMPYYSYKDGEGMKISKLFKVAPVKMPGQK
jgi:hypothetical protein